MPCCAVKLLSMTAAKASGASKTRCGILHDWMVCAHEQKEGDRQEHRQSCVENSAVTASSSARPVKNF
jgi:hypothetical protein